MSKLCDSIDTLINFCLIILIYQSTNIIPNNYFRSSVDNFFISSCRLCSVMDIIRVYAILY